MRVYVTEDNFTHTPYGCPLDYWITVSDGRYAVKIIVVATDNIKSKRVYEYDRSTIVFAPKTMVVLVRDPNAGVWLKSFALSSRESDGTECPETSYRKIRVR